MCYYYYYYFFFVSFKGCTSSILLLLLLLLLFFVTLFVLKGVQAQTVASFLLAFENGLSIVPVINKVSIELDQLM